MGRSIVINSTFDPYKDWDNFVKPMEGIQKGFNETSQTLNDLEAQMANYSKYKNDEGSKEAYGLLKNAYDQVLKTRDDLYNNGYNVNTRYSLDQARKLLNNDASRAIQAFNGREELIKNRNEERAKDASIRYAKDDNEITSDFLLKHPQGFKDDKVSGDALAKEFGDMVKPIADRILQDPRYRNVLGGQYFEILKNYGMTPTVIQRFMELGQNNPNEFPELATALNRVIQAHGINNWDKWVNDTNGFKSDIWNSISRGAENAIGKSDISYQTNRGYDYAMKEAMEIRAENRKKQAQQEEAARKAQEQAKALNDERLRNSPSQTHMEAPTQQNEEAARIKRKIGNKVYDPIACEIVGVNGYSNTGNDEGGFWETFANARQAKERIEQQAKIVEDMRTNGAPLEKVKRMQEILDDAQRLYNDRYGEGNGIMTWAGRNFGKLSPFLTYFGPTQSLGIVSNLIAGNNPFTGNTRNSGNGMLGETNSSGVMADGGTNSLIGSAYQDDLDMFSEYNPLFKNYKMNGDEDMAQVYSPIMKMGDILNGGKYSSGAFDKDSNYNKGAAIDELKAKYSDKNYKINDDWVLDQIDKYGNYSPVTYTTVTDSDPSSGEQIMQGIQNNLGFTTEDGSAVKLDVLDGTGKVVDDISMADVVSNAKGNRVKISIAPNENGSNANVVFTIGGKNYKTRDNTAFNEQTNNILEVYQKDQIKAKEVLDLAEQCWQRGNMTDEEYIACKSALKDFSEQINADSANALNFYLGGSNNGINYDSETDKQRALFDNLLGSRNDIMQTINNYKAVANGRYESVADYQKNNSGIR